MPMIWITSPLKIFAIGGEFLRLPYICVCKLDLPIVGMLVSLQADRLSTAFQGSREKVPVRGGCQGKHVDGQTH